MSITSPVIEKHPSGYRLVYEDVYATGIDDLWQAITTPERLSRWMVEYTGDLRLGGTWAVAANGDEPSWATGTITACDAPRSFTTTWHAIEEEPTEVVVTLEEVEGGTRMRLVHTGIRSIFYGAGWQTYLERLRAHLAGESFEQEWDDRFAELSPEYEARFGAL
ncbi:SRPBCC domain-containing protein [Microbacterium sp. KUDC0406]|uniref:SRPBCC domain-containing protein n=1 Tax=Microbacterium sp. KUDC0406 TaxID=2909588 RepID=UPI001F34B4BA|nr:SRPBCC domain-containing protein [Microbacterium sp. KUDC0406]UJP08867.1 SRPBCC domain-containing protein [Microbacterium sp. KUDC0406]